MAKKTRFLLFAVIHWAFSTVTLADAEPLVTLEPGGSHILIPVMNAKWGGRLHTFGIYDGDTLLQTGSLSLAKPGEPQWLAAYPLAPIGAVGKTLTVRPVNNDIHDPELIKAMARIRLGEPEEIHLSSDYQEPYRNQFHASAFRGWNNDPNGMVYYQGKYHLYFQRNPFGLNWGNMHWGHWHSTDMIHWTEEPMVLFQNRQQDMMFSGGGFIDFNNSAGLGKDTLFIAFTSTGRGECLAYSHDGGMTFTEIEENPVVEHDGRDPKIIWHEPTKRWVMVVFNEDHSDLSRATPHLPGQEKRAGVSFDFYASTNLRQWEKVGEFVDEDRNMMWECPELFELPVEGEPGESRWIMYGASNAYVIGHFDGSNFHKESGPFWPADQGGYAKFFAAQTFSDMPDGRRVQMGWARLNDLRDAYPDQLTNQAMSLPQVLTLKRRENGLRLNFWPVEEVEKLRAEVLAEGKDLDVEAANELLQACVGELSEVLIEVDQPVNASLLINGIEASFEGQSVRVLTDRIMNESFVDGGRYFVLSPRGIGQVNSTKTVLELPEGVRVKELKAYRLKSIWR